MELVSLIVAAYNIKDYLAQCMDSCIRQSDRNVEIIAVDDGSTDKTAEILDRYRKDTRVQVIHHGKNRGLSEARKTGYAAATGKYVLFVDGDDWLEEDAAECLRTFAEEVSSDLLCFHLYLENAAGQQEYPLETFGASTGDDYLVRLLTGRIPPSIISKFIRKGYVDENHVVFPPRLNCGEDVALAASLGMHGPNAALLQKPLYHYRIRPESLSAKPSACMLDILPATRFIEERLKARGLYERYREEFAYYAFLHNLFYRFDAMFTIPNPYREQLLQNWLSLGLDLSGNRYFIKNFSEDTPKNQLLKNLCQARP